MKRSQRKLIAKLNELELDDFELFKLQANYFFKYFRRIRNAGLFFLFSSLLMFSLIYIAFGYWFDDIMMLCGGFLCGMVGWFTFKMAKDYLNVIRVSSKGTKEDRMRALLFFTENKYLKADPIAIYLAARLKKPG